MAVPETVTDARTWSELVVAIGAAFMAIVYGVTRVYKMAKNVDDLVELVKENGKFAKEAAVALEGVTTDLQEVKAHVERLQSWQDKEEGRREEREHHHHEKDK